jgi:Clostripain family
MIEVAHEIQDLADYIVGSQESPPGAGLPYDRVFKPFRDNPDASTLSLSKSFVDGMLAEYGQSQFITQSVIDTSQLPGLASSITSLANELTSNLGLASEYDAENQFSDFTWTSSGFTTSERAAPTALYQPLIMSRPSSLNDISKGLGSQDHWELTPGLSIGQLADRGYP